MRAAMERREAPGLLARARAPRDPHLPQDTWVPEAWRVAGFVNPGRGGLANLLGASRRSIPLLWEREGKTGRRAHLGVRKTKSRAAERWLNARNFLLGQLDVATPFASPARSPATPGTACRAYRRAGCLNPTARRRWH